VNYSRQGGAESTGLQARHLRAGYFLMPWTKHSLLRRGSWRKALLRREMRRSRQNASAFPGRAGGGFLPRVRAIGKSQRSFCALSTAAPRIIRSRPCSRRSTRLALRRSARQTPAAGFARTKGLAMKVTISTTARVTCPLWNAPCSVSEQNPSGQVHPNASRKQRLFCCRAWDITPLWFPRLDQHNMRAL